MIDLKDLLAAGVHFGHKTSRWSPKMKPFIWGSKNKIHLIDIAKTAFLMERAGKYLQSIAAEGKSILFIGTKKAAQGAIFKTAKEINSPYVTNRWVGGTLTNFDQVKKAITRLLHLQDIIRKPTDYYKKKELSMIQKEVARLEKNIGGILDLRFPPGAIVIIDAKKEISAVREAINAGIPVVALVDTNTDPSGINFVIPANDDSARSIEFVLQYLATFVKEGQKAVSDKKTAIKDSGKDLIKKAKEAATSTIKQDAEKAPAVAEEIPAVNTEVLELLQDLEEDTTEEITSKKKALIKKATIDTEKIAPKKVTPKRTTTRK